MRFFIQRLAASFLVLVGVSMVIFTLARVIPGDPARIALGPLATQGQVNALRSEMHLDKPLPVQYWYFLGGVVHGDLGMSLYSKRPVTEDIRSLFPATLELVLVAGLLMALFGIPLGILSARYRDGIPDHLGRIFSLLGVVTPSFIWAIVLMLVFSFWLGITPIAGRLSDGSTPPPSITGMYLLDSLLAGNMPLAKEALGHMLLPSVALSLSGIGQTSRMMRTSMVESYEKPYTEMARAFGLSARSVNFKYALRPALIPTLTIMGLDFASTLGNAFLVENVFGWPGIARYGVQAVLHKDLNAIVGTVIIIAAFFLIVNTIVDFLVSLINPRVRLGGK